ncbi:MAG: hypothetical protein NDI61_13625 [Bdellovibrionaceae bacterium]|nr:hypothetical protein [Pseudobdellovibrionaceae bacterium]
MRRKRIREAAVVALAISCVTLVGVTASRPASADSAGRPVGVGVSSLNRGRYKIDLQKQPSAKVRAVARGLSALGYDIAGIDFPNRSIEVILSEPQAERLRQKYRLHLMKMADSAVAPDSRYLSPEKVEAKLRELAARYPRFAQLHEIGRTTENRSILALEISTPDPVLKPTVLFDGMHHAREIMTPEIVVDIAESLLQSTQYGRRIRKGRAMLDWLSRVRVWVVPQVNPDGNHIVWTSDPWWRKNAWRESSEIAGIDLNRNYAFQWGSCQGSSDDPASGAFRGRRAASEPETQAIVKLAEKIRPIGYLTYHSHGEYVLAPYGCQNQFTAEHELLAQIGQPLAESLPRDQAPGHYAFGTGWQLLYPTDGTSKDYIYASFGAPSFTIEVNTDFQPDYAVREPTLRKHRVGWALFIDLLMKNLLTVRVKDANGRPLQARVEFSSITHKAGERVLTTDETGVLFKVLAPGQTLVRITDVAGRTRERALTMSGAPQFLDVTF